MSLLLLLLFGHQVGSDSFVTSGTIARQAPLSIGFPRCEYWSGWPFHSPGDLPNPQSKPTCPALQVDSLPLSHRGSPLSSLSYFKKTLSFLAFGPNSSEEESAGRPWQVGLVSTLEDDGAAGCRAPALPEVGVGGSGSVRVAGLPLHLSCTRWEGAGGGSGDVAWGARGRGCQVCVLSAAKPDQGPVCGASAVQRGGTTLPPSPMNPSSVPWV